VSKVAESGGEWKERLNVAVKRPRGEKDTHIGKQFAVGHRSVTSERGIGTAFAPTECAEAEVA
jgi:hypothetical protein